MLIDTPYKNGDVVTLRMLTGEEVVTTLVSEDAVEVTVDRPMVIATGPEGMGLVPFLFTVDPSRKIKINRAAIAVMCKTNEEISSGYTQKVTGLTV